VVLNAFSCVAAFAAVLRAILALLVLVVGIRAIRRWRGEGSEERYYLLGLASLTLLALAVVSWPLLYLVLGSYVPLWPGVMCIRGVTRIGTGSVGASSWLPPLVGTLLYTKPLLIFVSGAWLALHLVSRQAKRSGGTPTILLALLLLGTLALADSAVETAYLFIPKQETFLEAGCCAASTSQVASEDPVVPAAAASPHRRGVVTAAFLATGVATLLALTLAIRRRRGLLLPLAAAAASIPVGIAFLGVAAPWFLHLPYHDCVYCLLGQMPETGIAIGLYTLGAFAVGWAALACSFGREGGSGEGVFLPLLRAARFCYLGALLMAAVMMGNA
jgi:hypothetical protein